MSVDPYHAVQQEIQSSLQTATQLQSSFLRIQSMARPGSEELMWARNELKATLASLEADLEDLEESVKIVESTDARMFGLDDAEVQNRRRYVGHVRKEIEMMIREQDQTMDSIAGTLTNIAQQASLMGQEINEHNEMLTDLEQGVDQSDSKLSDGMRRMRKFLRDSEEKGSSWCIVILMIVLMALLLAVILV
ncbi:hypothetical protein NLJ89_g11262 [Agrocybe chaxingu]|uniref:t-SNARE coiled-coil homology domain-containing protein n=1 Tax=Agrocybe chaxingu TaxID=84603 RepID=A0A9W8MPI6_9AGAR|nr:hypothetical protein NLJ89_g11262 [Agrocybe chaxingu]